MRCGTTNSPSDSSGSAVEDRSKKGYLGQAISDAVELATTGSLVLEQGFEGAALPASFTANPGPRYQRLRVSHAPDEVIGGSGSLVLDNPDHTKQQGAGVRTNPQLLQLTPLGTYLLTFDWRILEEPRQRVRGRREQRSGPTPGSLRNLRQGCRRLGKGALPLRDSERRSMVYLVLSRTEAVRWPSIMCASSAGGIGPWRRDFENGFVLVNPFEHPHTFLAGDLAGGLKRTGIRRIKGTQAPEVNDGRPVTDHLTLRAFDAIILLADHIDAPPSFRR